MAGVTPKLWKLTDQDIEAIEALRKAGHNTEAVLELVARAFVRAREKKESYIRLTPRTLTGKQLAVVRSAVEQLGVSEADLLKMVQNAARWAVREYAEVALRDIEIEPGVRRWPPYKVLVARCKPLNRVFAALMGIDAARALRETGASDKAVAAAEASQGAAKAAGSRAPGALAAMEYILDSHHIIEANWFEQFKDAFAKLGWKSVDDMEAIAIPVDVHQRSLSGLLKALNYKGGPSPGLAAEFTQVTTVLQHRLRGPDRFGELSAQQRASGMFFEITDQTTAKDLVDAHLKVYATEPGLEWLHKLVKPRLTEIIAKLATP